MTARRAFAIALTSLALAACGGGQRQEEPPPAAPEPSTPPGQTVPPVDDGTAPSEGTMPDEGMAPEGEDAATPPGAQGRMGMNCPTAIGGTQVKVEDTVDGVAIRFTNPAQADEVRRRVNHMAEMHDVRRVAGGGMHGGMHHGTGGGVMHMDMPAHTARVQNVDDGALLVMVPVATTDLDKLRAQTRTLATSMEGGQCPMMDGGMNQPGVPMDEETLETEEVPGAGE